ncbi:RHE_PE00001 family protein [Aminobacter sp. AP02]|uniref:RHE_PE00001 family protein n=1 Tax=Aminobacter sp. AP02 TaxID=2135737 RepID=UPI000D6D722F|nr:RHE_PE00001 family protein [Aminobacter sp. AP02]PWK76799.1 DNA binding protein with HTH domain [Aminobacter sp. AP02]
MTYDLTDLPLTSLIGPAMRASEALVRLDERIARSPVGQGFVERGHFTDAVSSLWLDGELVHIEDLVLHDAHMDLRAPTHELTRAHEILRLRRQIFANRPSWALGREGLATLCGRGAAQVAPRPQYQEVALGGEEDEDDGDDTLKAEMAALDAALDRAQAVLERTPRDAKQPATRAVMTVRRGADDKNPLIYDADWDEPERLAAWQRALSESEGLPPLLRAAVAFDAWSVIAPLQHAPWLGRLLVEALLRETATTTAHLAALYFGARIIPREIRHSRDRAMRLVAFLDGVYETAKAGAKEHDRLILAKTQMDRRLKGRRSTSKLPQLIDLVLSRPLVSSGMVEKELGVTTAGALNLIGELDLREITGRGRYRAWGIM